MVASLRRSPSLPYAFLKVFDLDRRKDAGNEMRGLAYCW